MKHIKGIIFDIDGTLIPESDVLKAQADAVAWKFGSTQEEQQRLITAFFSVNTEEAKKQSRLESHQKNNLVYYFETVAERLQISVTPDECKRVVADWRAAFGRAQSNPSLFPDVLSTLTALKESGYTLYIASGSTLENRQALLVELAISDLFTEVFAARTIGFQKQDARFWQHVLEKIDYTPDELLVVGNQLNDDIVHPQSLGMTTILIERGEALQKYEDVSEVVPDYTLAAVSQIVEIL